MKRGFIGILILSLSTVHGAIETTHTAPSQMPSLWNASSAPWHNQTCEDLCACVMGVMGGMRTPQICLQISGYPCHLVKQLTRSATTQNCSVTVGRNWFECDKGMTDCVGGEMSVDDEENCTASEAGGASNTAYLGCEAAPGRNTSVTCMLSRDSQAVGQCVNNAACLYKKVTKMDPVTERVSCRGRWIPYKKHCLSPINGIKEPNILDQQTWGGAEDHCRKRWDASLITLDSFGEGTLRGLEERGILLPDQAVWLGLSRDTANSSFNWEDDTVTLQPQGSWPWAEGHPAPGLNKVYILNKQLYTAESSKVNRYSCKIKVSKSLKCRQPVPTEMPLTTATAAVSLSSSHLPTSPKTKEEESMEEFIEELTEVRNDVSNYLKTFTNDTAVLEAMDSMMSIPRYSSPDEASPNKEAQDQSTAIMNTLDSMVDGLAESITGPAEPLVVSTPEIVLKVMTLCLECEDGEAIGGQLGNQSFSLSLPDSVKAAGATLAMSSASLLHEQLPSTIDDGEEGGKTEIGSLVSSISLHRWDGESIELTVDQPMKLTFSSLKKFPDATPTCRYWKETEGKDGVWSSEGCVVAKSNGTHTTCDITHLTSFAVIMQISHHEDPLPISLDYLTWAGCALSITCLAVMLIVFLTQRMYRADRNIIHMNLATALLLAQLIFVFGIDRTENEGICKSVGICVHFFLLATFFWMLNEGIFLLSKTTSAKTRWLRLPTYFTVGWVFPLVIVVVTMAASFDSYDTTDRCWLTIDDGGIWAFVGPAAAVILINICVLVQVIRVFLSLRANMNKKKVERIRIALRAILLTMPLLGCTWLIGMLSFNSSTLVFAYIFVALNSLQGVFIFILYCLLNDEIKKGLRKRLALLQSLSGRTSHTRASRTTTSGSTNPKSTRASKTAQPEQDGTKL